MRVSPCAAETQVTHLRGDPRSAGENWEQPARPGPLAELRPRAGGAGEDAAGVGGAPHAQSPPPASPSQRPRGMNPLELKSHGSGLSAHGGPTEANAKANANLFCKTPSSSWHLKKSHKVLKKNFLKRQTYLLSIVTKQ